MGRLVLITALAAVLHVALGWEWTMLAGGVGGFWVRRGGWWFGALAVALDYLIFVVYSFVVDARAVGSMAATVGALLGNMPSWAVVAITLFTGAVLGMLGGAAGTQARCLADLYLRGANAAGG